MVSWNCHSKAKTELSYGCLVQNKDIARSQKSAGERYQLALALTQVGPCNNVLGDWMPSAMFGCGYLPPSWIWASSCPSILETWSFNLAWSIYCTPVSRWSAINWNKIQVRPTYNAPKLGVIVDMARIQVVTQSAFEHGGILRNDSEASTKISQSNRRHIEPINTKFLLA
jgi:hypothetical protein